MGKLTLRGAVAGVAAATAFSLMAVPALAAVDGDLIDVDGAPTHVKTINGPDIYRFADRDYTGTSVQAALRTKGVWGDSIIIANTDVYADALAATPLADVIDAPVVLNKPGSSVDARITGLIQKRNFKNVIVLGGTDVFTPAFVQSLQADGLNVKRVAGTNRYQTAVELAAAAVVADQAKDPEDREYRLDQGNIFLASGTDFPDALTAGAAAAEKNGVILLTKGSEGLDSVTYAAITGVNIAQQGGQLFADYADNSSVIAVGGPAAAGAAKGWTTDPVHVNKSVVGSDRYDTAAKVAQEFFDFDDVYAASKHKQSHSGYITIASGEHFANAVVAGAFASNVDGPLLLTRTASLSKVTGAYLESIRLDIDSVFVFGGPDSVAPVVSDQISKLNWRY